MALTTPTRTPVPPASRGGQSGHLALAARLLRLGDLHLVGHDRQGHHLRRQRRRGCRGRGRVGRKAGVGRQAGRQAGRLACRRAAIREWSAALLTPSTPACPPPPCLPSLSLLLPCRDGLHVPRAPQRPHYHRLPAGRQQGHRGCTDPRCACACCALLRPAALFGCWQGAPRPSPRPGSAPPPRPARLLPPGPQASRSTAAACCCARTWTRFWSRAAGRQACACAARAAACYAPARRSSATRQFGTRCACCPTVRGAGQGGARRAGRAQGGRGGWPTGSRRRLPPRPRPPVRHSSSPSPAPPQARCRLPIARSHWPPPAPAPLCTCT